jgi:hypothetical protein
MIGGEEHQRVCRTCLMPIVITLWLANEVLSLLAKKNLYEMMAGLKINFNKSEVIMINDLDNLGQTYADIFNGQIGYFPITYLVSCQS